MSLLDSEFWGGKRVLLTGHTGFKGSWAAALLSKLGAQVTGLALEPESTPSLFEEAQVSEILEHHVVDVRDAAAVAEVVQSCQPEIVLHMAAQALVRRSYRQPLATFETNVQGTANLLSALLECEAVHTVLVVTSDKVYENREDGRAFRESDPLGGHDPYSASKAAAEIVVASYRMSFFAPKGVRVATARGGNVIGGGDFSEDRIVPDVWRAIRADQPVSLRNSNAVRPWQHVLDCLHGYLTYLQALARASEVPPALNIGPKTQKTVSVKKLSEAFYAAIGREPNIHVETAEQPPEKALLSLDTQCARDSLGWQDLLTTGEAVAWTARWYGEFSQGVSAKTLTERQIEEFLNEGAHA